MNDSRIQGHKLKDKSGLTTTLHAWLGGWRCDKVQEIEASK